MASTIGGGAGALAWAMYAWVTTGSPGTLIFGLHAVHVGVIVSIPLMIIVSLCTKPDYEKAELTSWKALGKEMKETTLIPESEKCNGKGFFGWLGADTGSWKVFWIGVLVIFIAHYVLSLGYVNMPLGIAMTWVSFAVGTIMIFIMAILGGKDIVGMVKESKEAEMRMKKG